MNNAIKKTDDITHILNNELNLQKTSGSNYWNSSNYSNLTCQVRNGLQLSETDNSFETRTFSAIAGCYWKSRPHIIEKTMTIVAIPERIFMKEGVKTARFTLIFVGNGYHA